jgi:DASS family divalent anion:Na+ symporter
MENINEIKVRLVSIILLAASFFWLVFPVPSGLSAKAWHMLIIFVATMVGIMSSAVSLCGTLFFSLLFASLTGTIDFKTNGLTGFSNIVPWLLFFISAFSKSISNSSIGHRIAYFFVELFGKTTLGLAYSISATEMILATILPSNTARSASVGLPVITSLAKYISSDIRNVSEKNIGAFLSIVYTSANAICSGMFLTGMISNTIVADIAAEHGLRLTWLSWARYMFVPCTIILLILPFVLFFLLPPKITRLENIQQKARTNAAQLGPLSSGEKYTIAIFCCMLIMWILADVIGISVLTTTLLGVCILMLLRVLSLKDILSDPSIWNSVITLGVLISYANCMTDYGTINWFHEKIELFVSACPEQMRLLVLSTIYFATHYFFSGEGARIIALNLPFVLTGLSLGIDKFQLIITLAAFGTFSDMLAHYTCPASILMFGPGYITASKWMKVGGIVSAISIAVWFLTFVLPQ